MAKSTVSNRKNSKVTKKGKRKSVISQADKKRTKIKVAQMNKEGMLLSDILKLNNEEKVERNDSNKNTLEANKLSSDNKKDRKILGKIKAEKQQTEDSILKQIELMSGFSL